jgi:cytochrome c553
MKISKMILVSAFLTLSTIVSAQSTPSGFDIGRCTKCHSEDRANQEIGFPRLAGQTPEYFLSAMSAYKNVKRHTFSAERYMSRRLTNLKLSDKTINQLSDYFTSLPAIAGIPGEATKVAAGKEIYTNSCAMCHGDKAEGAGVNARLAGQYKSFLSNQLHAYQEGKVENAGDMTDMAKTLSESDIDAVSTYLQSL